MRNGQNNKRMRGRNNNNNNNRKSSNPLTRVYESNGPDIKIRGTASHVAEKYIQLARDSQASGDPVAAENYYQHAEHYFRIINADGNGGQPYQHPDRRDAAYDAEHFEQGQDGQQEDANGEVVREQAREPRDTREARDTRDNGPAVNGTDPEAPAS